MSRTRKHHLVRLGLALVGVFILAACGSSTSDSVSPSTSTPAVQSSTSTASTTPTTSTTEPVATSQSSTSIGVSLGGCPDGLSVSPATVIGVQDWIRIRTEPTTASDEIGRFDAGASVSVYRDTLSYDGSDYWWVTAQAPDAGTCGSVAAKFLTDRSGRLDQQIPGLSFQAPTTSGTWAYGDRVLLSDPIDGSLDGAFFTHYTVIVTDGLLIDQILANQLKEFEDFDYDYPADWYSEATVPGADRAVRLIPVGSPSGDLLINRLLIEIGQTTVQTSTDVYIEDLDEAPLDDLSAFLDSFAFDKTIFLQAVSP